MSKSQRPETKEVRINDDPDKHSEIPRGYGRTDVEDFTEGEEPSRNPYETRRVSTTDRTEKQTP